MKRPGEVIRYARYTAETYSTPTQFGDPDEFLKALTEALDDLTTACGMEPPVLEGVFK